MHGLCENMFPGSLIVVLFFLTQVAKLTYCCRQKLFAGEKVRLRGSTLYTGHAAYITGGRRMANVRAELALRRVDKAN